MIAERVRLWAGYVMIYEPGSSHTIHLLTFRPVVPIKLVARTFRRISFIVRAEHMRSRIFTHSFSRVPRLPPKSRFSACKHGTNERPTPRQATPKLQA
jgi:hypothetical protein